MPRPTHRTLAAAAAFAALLAAVVLPVTPASAKKRVKNVHPDSHPSHAISNTLFRARPGTTLRIHPGRYRESLVINKRVKLIGVGRRRPVIDAGCDARFAVEVDVNNVKLVGLKVIGADGAPGTVPSEVDFTDVSGGRANDLVLRDTCDAEYGVNIYRTGPIEVRNSRAVGFDDAGFYVGGITSTPGGSIRVRRSEAYGNNRGVIIESSAGGDIRVKENYLHDNNVVLPPPIAPEWPPTGLLINDSDGVLVEHNAVLDNGAFGLRLAAGSDDNLINENAFTGNPVDVLDLGTGNCGLNNAFESGDPLPPC